MAETKTVVITGGSAGVGRAVARIFARRGYKVGLIARGEERLEEALGELETMGAAKVHTVSADVADADAVDAAAEEFERELGPIEVWVNDAMLTIYGRFMDVDPAEFDRITDVTYLGQVNGTRAALKRMIPRDRGAIVCVSSGLAFRGIPLQGAYCGAKFAIRGFFESVRSELIHDRVGVAMSMVHLPGVNTPQFGWAPNRTGQQPQPVAPVFQPEVPARAIVRAADTGERDLYVGGSVMQMIAGNILAPGIVDKFVADKAWQGQMSGKPDDGARGEEGNLFEPADKDVAAHGRFDSKAKDSALILNDTQLRGGFLLAPLVLGGAIALFASALLRRR